MDTTPERRASPRFPFHQPVLLRLENRVEPLAVCGVDLSDSGVCVNVPSYMVLTEGTPIRVNLSQPRPELPSRGREFAWYNSKVVRVDRLSRLLEKVAVVGLEFD